MTHTMKPIIIDRYFYKFLIRSNFSNKLPPPSYDHFPMCNFMELV